MVAWGRALRQAGATDATTVRAASQLPLLLVRDLGRPDLGAEKIVPICAIETWSGGWGKQQQNSEWGVMNLKAC